MKTSAIIASVFASVALVGCTSLTEFDNYDPPTSTLTGRVVFEGNPIGVRSNAVQLELWQPSFELNQKIPVHVDYDGTFSSILFDGSYEINLLASNGPWINDTKRIPIEVNGSATIDVPATPYYMIQNPQITFKPGVGTPGNIEATFTVRQNVTTPALEVVGVYIANTLFADRVLGLAIANSVRERTRAQVLTQLNANGPITISVPLPTNIYETGSPTRRDHVYVRVGVKTAGVTELYYSPVVKVSI